MRDTSKFKAVQKHYREVECTIKSIYEKNGVIKVAYIIVFNSVFPCRPVFEEMCKDPAFDPYIIVAPNISGTYKYLLDTYTETFDALSEQYGGRVINGYDCDSDEYLELKDDYNIIFFCNPYKTMVNPYHEVEYFLDKNVLPMYVSYGFAALKFFDEIVSYDFYNYMWKNTVETQLNLEYIQKTQKLKGKNCIVTGYIKMDKLALATPSVRHRKCILICPHHTVGSYKQLHISNFLTYAELFVELPRMFPDIDFVFRPHPLLFHNLVAYNIWHENQIKHYMERLLSSPNMVYDNSGDYMQKFVDSDAMIHDCGSFIGEYLYTEKPCCYMMRSLDQTMDGLLPLGQKCMDNYYHAFSEKDIISFIQDVVIDGKDPLKEQRESFAENEIKVNYPHAARYVCDMIKEELKI